MKTVKNEWGKEIDFEAAVEIMDDGIREDLSDLMAPCSNQSFFDAYCTWHRNAFGEEFEPNKKNGQW